VAIAVQEVATEVDHVVDTVMTIYRSHMEHAVAGSIAEFVAAPAGAGAVRAVSIPARRTIEAVLGDEADADVLGAVAWTLADRGWRLDVLCRADALGDAHGVLRGVPCRLQGWWADNLNIEFGAYERP